MRYIILMFFCFISEGQLLFPSIEPCYHKGKKYYPAYRQDFWVPPNFYDTISGLFEWLSHHLMMEDSFYPEIDEGAEYFKIFNVRKMRWDNPLVTPWTFRYFWEILTLHRFLSPSYYNEKAELIFYDDDSFFSFFFWNKRFGGMFCQFRAYSFCLGW